MGFQRYPRSLGAPPTIPGYVSAEACDQRVMAAKNTWAVYAAGALVTGMVVATVLSYLVGPPTKIGKWY